jgi:hypothetical protein
MLARATLAWLILLALAIANGTARESLLTPRFGSTLAHALSTVVLCILIFIVGSLVMPWIGPATARDAWVISGVWVVLTLAFEFLGGHFIFAKPWKALMEDYNILAGRIWVVVLVVTLLTPVISFKSQSPAQNSSPVAQQR